ncbi:MAG: lipopolysaccharide transport periplasmic protein LptA [Burkholderiales bacterium]
MKRARRNNLIFALALIAAPAFAELTDRDKPINIESDKATLDDVKKTATFTGNVVLTQGTFVIRADKLTVRQDAEGFRSGVATGNPATFRQKREGTDELVEGEGSRLEFDGKTDTVHIIGNGRVKRGQDEVRGSMISYNSRTEFFEVRGGGETAGKTSDRVKVVIQPKEKENEKAKEKKEPLPLKPSSGISKPGG